VSFVSPAKAEKGKELMPHNSAAILILLINVFIGLSVYSLNGSS